MTDNNNKMDQKPDDLRTQKQPDQQERDKLAKSGNETRQPNQAGQPDQPNRR
jgi:hypothetical protein